MPGMRRVLPGRSIHGWLPSLILMICIALGGMAAVAQTAPDAENGFKNYGSYHGTSLDTVNLMNGNWMLHAPFLPNLAQRGALTDSILMYSSGKTWQPNCSFPRTGPVCQWSINSVIALGGSPMSGVMITHGLGLTLARTVVKSDDGSGNLSIDVYMYVLTGPDSATHQLYPVTVDSNSNPVEMETVDTSGYHLSMSNPDVLGVENTVTVIDREGRRYAGQFDAYNHCTVPNISPIPSVGGRAPVQLAAPFGDQYCTQGAWLYQVTDSNGNQSSFSGPQNPNPGVDTMGRGQALQNGASTTDTSGCVSRLSQTGAFLLNYTTVNGAQAQIKWCTATLPLATAFSQTAYGVHVQEAPNNLQSSATVPVTAILADGSKWVFDYDSYGEIIYVGLPMGGSINLTWTTVAQSSGCRGVTPASRAVATRTLNDNNGNSYVWNYQWGTPSNGGATGSTMTNVVTDPLGNDTVHVFTGLLGCRFYETSTLSYQGPQSSGRLLQRVDTSYSSAVLSSTSGTDLGNVVPVSVQTTVYPSGKVKLVKKSYDTGLGTNTPIFGNVTQELEYDWGQGSPGALLRETDTTYQWQNDGRYLAAHLLDLPASVIVKDGNGNRVAETDYTYDESQYLTASNISTQHGAAPNAVRGNLTTVSKWLNTSSSPVVSHTNWYDTGEVYQTVDPLGNKSTHSYDPAYAGAYSTSTCNALNQCVSGAYDFNTGLLTSFTDANSNTSNYSYDLMWRLTRVQLPPDAAGNRPQTVLTYSPSNSFPVNIQRSKSITNSLNDVTTNYFDGLGRLVQSQHATPNGMATVQTSYDGLDHVTSVTNPYFSTSDPTYGVIQTQYDALGRVTQTTKQDGSAVTTQYDQTSANSPNGDCTITTDEAGKSRKSCLDGLSRLVEVDEPQASTGSLSNPYVTLYSYDALGNMLSVNQKGDGSQPARVRTFTYDSFSRLLTAANPESGTISYSYDANGNVLSKTSPAPNQTGSATQTISYCYDALNRIVGKAYSSQSCPLSSPVVTYSYDAGTNGVGHLASLTDQAGSGSYSYDALGRTTSEQRTIAGIQKSLSYAYNLDGSVATLTYPSGAVITYTPDSAGRMLSAVDIANNINYATGATYGADNSLTGFTSGNASSFAGIANSFSYNPRLQPVTMAATAPACTGSGCTASVTISGSLATAPSSTGTPPPNAAPGSALAGYEDSSGVNHWVYEGADQHLYEIYWKNDGTQRGYADVTVETGGPLAAPGSALSTYLDPNQIPHWIYEDGAQQVQLFWNQNGSWGQIDATALGGSPVAVAGSAVAALEDSNCMQHWAYFGSNHDLYEMHASGAQGCTGAGVWGYSDGTAATSTPAAASGSALSMYFDPNQIAHWIYEDNAQHVQLLWYYQSGGWGQVDLTATAGSPVAAAGSGLSASEDSHCMQHWAYFGANHHLYEMHASGAQGCTGAGVWGYSDGTAATGAPAAAGGSGLTTYFDATQTAHWLYQDGAQHLQLLWWYSSSGWGGVDVTNLVGSPVAAPGSALGSYEDSNCLQHWLYFGANNHLYEAHDSGSSGCTGTAMPGYNDLMTATPSMVRDSGTVSLSVGGFTATACFGSSTNPACSGQPVNNTAAQVTAALAQALNASNSPVTATASGATITMTWKASGLATPIGPLTTTHDNPSLFSNASFTSGAANFSGGTGANLPVFSIGYDFHLGNGDNGNVYGITNYRDTSRSQTFTYDALNRLTSAQNAGTDCSKTTANGKTEYWGNSYGYDAWGNLLQKSVTKCSAENLSVTALANNQLSGYGYDAAGNMIHDATTGNNYSFDQENRIIGAAGYTYTYDADGNRVEKSNGSTGTIYWSMTPGIVAESDLSGNLQSEYVFFNGERVARKDLPSNAVSYYFSDDLKTASVITDSAGNIKSESDFYPWGGELSFLNNDSNHYKYGGHERDNETGLDYMLARYYSNPLGRFLTPDWDGHPTEVPYANFGNPQSLNLYTYGKNNPTTFGDPDGHLPILTFEDWKRLGQKLGEAAKSVGGFIKDVWDAAGNGSPFPTTMPRPHGTCICPPGTNQNQNNDGKQNNNNSQSQNTSGEQSGSSQGKSGQGGRAPSQIDRKAFKAERETFWKNEAKEHPENYSAENLERMQKGKPPVGSDGHPMELHHVDRTQNGGLESMTRTDHRLGKNFKKNHPD